MKITVNRSSPRFWLLYFAVHFSFLLVILFVFRLLWSKATGRTDTFQIGEIAFESLVYAVLITIVKGIQYHISRKHYEKDPTDRCRYNAFRE